MSDMSGKILKSIKSRDLNLQNKFAVLLNCKDLRKAQKILSARMFSRLSSGTSYLCRVFDDRVQETSCVQSFQHLPNIITSPNMYKNFPTKSKWLCPVVLTLDSWGSFFVDSHASCPSVF